MLKGVNINVGVIYVLSTVLLYGSTRVHVYIIGVSLRHKHLLV